MPCGSLHHHQHQLIDMDFYSNRRFFLGIIFLASLAGFASLSYGQDTRIGYYLGSCPSVSSIVHNTVKKHFDADPKIAPSLLRMHFHDCFVNGCDGSILLNGSISEKTAVPNLSLRGYEAIDEAKKNLEAACPGVVSCADILALAARDSVMLTGGFGWLVPTGRRDGRVSLAVNTRNLPAPTDNVTTQIKKFKDLGLDVQDLVTLVGAHTIGTAGCAVISYRLYNYNSTGLPDPSIDPAFLPTLRNFCPQNGNASVRVPLDFNSEKQFDHLYFRKVRLNRGVLESDQRLWGDNSTKPVVEKYLGLSGFFGLTFKLEFPKSMVKMSNIGVLTGANGEIRKVCSAINTS